MSAPFNALAATDIDRHGNAVTYDAADAPLIAAAPAMLAALQRMIPLALEALAERACSDDDRDRELLPDYRRDVAEARAAIAAATGEGR